MTGNVCSCGRPVTDARVCAHCLAGSGRCSDPGCRSPHLLTDLDDIPALVDELWIVIGRQMRYGDRIGGGTSSLPVNRHLGTLLGSLRNTLAVWCHAVADERGVPVPSVRRSARRTPIGEGEPRPANPTRCEWSDLITENCDHCRSS